jgi:murein DD-endopeptidase MepM/ murein hydrolase activator NlpD
MRPRSLALSIALAAAALSAEAARMPAEARQAARYPVISSLDARDPAFSELQRLIAEFYRASAASQPLPDLAFFAYDVAPGDDLLSLSSRLMIPYDALATLNRISEPAALKAGARLVIPSMPGVFLPETPGTDLEYLMRSWRELQLGSSCIIRAALPSGVQSFAFFSGERFHPAERAFFLNALFRFPLPKAKVTSGFGVRPNPFGLGVERHSGLDLAAPEGTPVLAARKGVVVDSGFDPIYGNYVLVAHEGEWHTLYGHLASIAVRLKQSVDSGMMIGTVGSTGRSTGPHLHFEVRSSGVALDPENYLPRRSP